MKKLAFCFLIYDVINHEEIWNQFFKNVDPSRYGIYIHYKTNTPLKFFEKHKLDHCIPTNYATISLIHAQNLLIQAALKETDIEHIVFVSGACIPLKPFNYIYESLDSTKSYFNTCPQTQCFPRCDPSLSLIEKPFIQKAHQWCILNRKHANLMITTSNYLTWFDYKGCVPDEHCYISNLYKHGLQGELITTPNWAAGATTFTNWEGMEYPFPSTRDLKNYTEISGEELLYLLASKSLFGRKFKRECMGSLSNGTYLKFISS